MSFRIARRSPPQRVDLENFSDDSSVISGIVPTPRRPGRFDILVDGRAYATLSLGAIERLQLVVGRLVGGMAEHIRAEANELTVHDRALNMLAFRARSATELARALVRKGEGRAVVDRVIGALRERGLLNDADYAHAFARAKIVGARKSKRRVQQDLSAKGVARDVSDAAVEQVCAEEGVDQQEIVVEVARKKLRSLARHEPAVRTRRLYAFLARRGYESDHIRRAMRVVGQELDDEVEVRDDDE